MRQDSISCPEEKCTAKEMGARPCAFVEGHAEAEPENSWWQGLLVFRWRVDTLLPCLLSSDVLVSVAFGILYGALPMICDEGRRHIIDGRSGSTRQDCLRSGSVFPKVTSSFCMHKRTAEA